MGNYRSGILKGGPQEESSFWTSICFLDKIGKIKNNFKEMTFFGLHLNFERKFKKSESVSKQ